MLGHYGLGAIAKSARKSSIIFFARGPITRGGGGGGWGDKLPPGAASKMWKLPIS